MVCTHIETEHIAIFGAAPKGLRARKSRSRRVIALIVGILHSEFSTSYMEGHRVALHMDCVMDHSLTMVTGTYFGSVVRERCDPHGCGAGSQ